MADTKTLILGILISFSSVASYTQINVSEVIQESQISQSQENKLYFIDFWATWCGPCVYAKKMLTVLQKQHPKDFYVISLSDESASLVERYLSKRPSELAIAVDDFGNTFNTYNIISRPQGVLLNAKGEKLWQGHPSDLSSQMVNRFLKNTTSRVSVSDFIKTVQKIPLIENDYTLKADFELKEYKKEVSQLEVYETDAYLRLRGKLDKILGYLTKTYEGQIDVSENANKTYELYVTKSYKYLKDYGFKVINKLNLQLIEKQIIGEVMLLEVDRPNFWDTKQIDWGKNGTKYLLGDTDITADNISLNELSYLMAEVLETPIVVSTQTKDDLYSLHDWQLHYKYYQFMESNLLDYGISVSKTKSSYPKYIITKKAP
ncbi:MAG: TlpA family protein disulfide reductase [Winogradskyella sp.]|uniref:TlpA family protein disulfide reductase n=1 Tax=Winogradskyella sp. TaxID=1883156 RepID=UPI000F418CAE|nr:TlpA disulfide reductase family protein [Winogradskyella sp.]RNC86740.1 MAG: TlpA family protein disulfide reductase [Winogradskyella sp.]